MNTNNEPLVTVLTPVYNGEAYLRECIESVLKQTYRNFEYHIVNNRSKDRTLEIASDYAKRDSRIRVHDNAEFVPVIENHNIAFHLLSNDSKYCKLVCADDWLFPDCITQMVAVAEANPSVGIVGSYQMSGGGSDWRNWSVRWDELPFPSTVVSGRELCRATLLDGPYVFGDPTSLLYRSDLIRKEREFFPSASPHADTSACYKYLRDTNFGFVHQVLSYERVHGDRQSAHSEILDGYTPAKISDLLTYGSFYLTEAEIKGRLKETLDFYYKMLALGVLGGRNTDYWRFHREKLNELGHPLDRLRLSKAVLLKLIDLSLNPKQSVEKLLRRLSGVKFEIAGRANRGAWRQKAGAGASTVLPQ
jgi:glycosyltransferase involved in cell wall biosynthesis